MSHPRVGNSAVLDVGAMKTHFQVKVAAEHWINIAGRDYRLVGKTIRIGRAPDNDIVIDHKSCSRYHAVITMSDGRILLEDLKSRNGIVVNGIQTRRAELSDNDSLKIGDLSGVYYLRGKLGESKAVSQVNDILGKIFPGGIRGAMDAFSQLDAQKKKKIIVLVGMIGAVLFILSGQGSGRRVAEDMSAAVSGEVVQGEPDRKAFDRCLEHEDLGNYLQANKCFKKLPATADVQIALGRISQKQQEFSELRYKEGSKAFDNYYFDIAILKWQEVLLVADDSSEYRTKALAGIQKAEERKRLR